MFADLASFLAELERRRELVRIPEPVSPDLEMAAVIDRVSKSPGGGPALLFEQPSGAAQPENSTASQAGEAASTDPVEG